MYGNRCNITDRFHIPYFTEQFLFCKYMIWILCQKSQQIKLFCRKLFLFSIDPYPARRLVYFNAQDLNDIILWHIAADQSLIPCQMCLHTGYQFTRGKRFCHIIVCPQSEPANLVNIILFCRNHKDWCILYLTDLFTDFKSIYSRKHEI